MPASVISFSPKKSSKVAIVPHSRSKVIRAGDTSFEESELNPTLTKLNEFWTLMETIKRHGYLRASMSVVGRSAIGAWWTLVRHEEFGKGAPERHRKRLYSFYAHTSREWNNIRDYESFAAKLLIAVQYLKFFGQVAFQILRDSSGAAVGLDHLPGLVVPNVDSNGRFKTPAFYQFLSSDYTKKVEFNNPKDIVFVTNPDWEGSPIGGSDVEALTEWTLPLDIYLQTAARDYMRNRNKPELIFSLPPDISDEAFDDFVREVEARWTGPKNIGRNPIAVQGEFKVTELGKLPDGLPYQSSRKDAREEELAVTGVPGAKLGLSDSVSSANIRELRREFHETSLVPLFRLLETALYEQVHVRELGFDGWILKFNNPDFLNAVERATVHMRYRQMGAMSPNEVRNQIGLPKRKDEQGDMFEGQEPEEEEEEPQDEIPNPQGNPPEGRPVDPDDPSQTGEPNDEDDADPERGDQHDDEVRNSLIDELSLWKEFAKRRIRKGKSLREFRSYIIPHQVSEIISQQLGTAETVEDVNKIFKQAIADVEEVLSAEV